jgi:tripartite-type tricarboxylate transporter receptor subunit TctC
MRVLFSFLVLILITTATGFAPDGHTILYTFNGTMAQVPYTVAGVSYDPFKDFTAISLGARGSA